MPVSLLESFPNATTPRERIGQRVARQRSLQQAPVRAAQECARAPAQDVVEHLPNDLRARGRRCQAGAVIRRCMGMPSRQSLASAGRSLAPAERARNAGARPAGLPALDSRNALPHALLFLCTPLMGLASTCGTWGEGGPRDYVCLS